MSNLVENIKHSLAIRKIKKCIKRYTLDNVIRQWKICQIKRIIKKNPNLGYMTRHFHFAGGGFATFDMFDDLFGIKRKKPKMTEQEYSDGLQRIEYLEDLDLFCGGVAINVTYPAATWDGFNIWDEGIDYDENEEQIRNYWNKARQSLKKRYKGDTLF